MEWEGRGKEGRGKMMMVMTMMMSRRKKKRRRDIKTEGAKEGGKSS